MGEGSTFTARIPIKIFNKPIVNNETNETDLPAGRENYHTKKSALIVEDDERSQLLTKRIFSSHGFDVVVIESMDEMTPLRANTFDIILCDIHLKYESGFDLMAYFDDNFINSKHALKVFMTADIRSEIQNKCLEYHVDGFLKKPIIKEELFDIIDKVHKAG